MSASRAAIKKALLALQLTRKEETREERKEEPPGGFSSTLPALKSKRKLVPRGLSGGAAGPDGSALAGSSHGAVFRGQTVSEQMRKRERLKRAGSKGEEIKLRRQVVVLSGFMLKSEVIGTSFELGKLLITIAAEQGIGSAHSMEVADESEQPVNWRLM